MGEILVRQLNNIGTESVFAPKHHCLRLHVYRGGDGCTRKCPIPVHATQAKRGGRIFIFLFTAATARSYLRSVTVRCEVGCGQMVPLTGLVPKGTAARRIPHYALVSFYYDSSPSSIIVIGLLRLRFFLATC